MNLRKITIQRYRSINNLTVEIKDENSPLIICGSNNVGKTNFLRALDLFFSLDKDRFNKDSDIPYDIAAGRSTGGRYVTTFRAEFDNEVDEVRVRVDYKWNVKTGNSVEISGEKNGVEINEAEIRQIIKDFRYIFVEASNISIPKIIDEILDEEILPIGLDTLRAKQKEPLRIFRQFIEKSEESVKKIESEVGEILNEFITEIPGIDTKGWKIEILFSEYQKLREAISGLINFTLYDKNKKRMESKGSGIQRIVFLSLLKYIANHSRKKIIWGIDEPEAFLQPALQKRVFQILCDIAKKHRVFITTHSPHMININSLSNTCLFDADYSEREFAKKKGEVFYKVNTHTKDSGGESDKIQAIKHHLGITRNDGWEVFGSNLIVEGEEDKFYLSTLLSRFGYQTPNILFSGGADKIRGYLQFLKEFCEDLKVKPDFLCLLDHDDKGKEVKTSLENKNYNKFNLKLSFIPRFDGSKHIDFDYEIEDFIYPEIIHQAANEFLKKQRYNKIPKRAFEDRFKSAYDKTCILEFFDEVCKNQNPDKPHLVMASEGVKRVICEKALRILRKIDLGELDKKYPEVKKFLSLIAGAKETKKIRGRKKRIDRNLVQVLSGAQTDPIPQ